MSNALGCVPIAYIVSTSICRPTVDTVISCLVVMAVMAASVLMHMSETKHKLRPQDEFLRKASTLFLNVDRFAAIIAFGWFAFQWSLGGYVQPKMLLVVICIGGLCNFIGEQVDNFSIYMFTHVVWHGCAYAAIVVALWV